MAEEVFLYLPLKSLEREFVFSNGMSFPKISFGVTHLDGFRAVYNAVDLALGVGYRSFDCSPKLMSEALLGKALEELLPIYRLKRKDILITTKILTQDYGMDSTSEAIIQSLKNLRTDYIDLFLMDWPGGHNLDPDSEESQYLREDTWKEILEMSEKGVIKSCGVCHFTCDHLENIQNSSGKFPVLVQTEFHPKCPQVELLQYCEEKNIVVQACSFRETVPPLLNIDETIRKVAKEVKKTPTQVLLKWMINKGVGVISQSEKSRKIIQNFQIFDFVLNKPQMTEIDAIEARVKFLRNPVIVM